MLAIILGVSGPEIDSIDPTRLCWYVPVEWGKCPSDPEVLCVGCEDLIHLCPTKTSRYCVQAEPADAPKGKRDGE